MLNNEILIFRFIFKFKNEYKYKNCNLTQLLRKSTFIKKKALKLKILVNST